MVLDQVGSSLEKDEVVSVSRTVQINSILTSSIYMISVIFKRIMKRKEGEIRKAFIKWSGLLHLEKVKMIFLTGISTYEYIFISA